MGYYEKFYIGVPAETYATLRRDADQFGIYRDNSTEVNMNGFLSLLILGYYSKYNQERSDKLNQIREKLEKWINVKKKAEEVAEQLLEEVVLPAVPKRKGKNPKRLSYKPTGETIDIINELKDGKSSYTEYLCRMLMSYCEKPIHERERIVFRDNADFLLGACKGKREIVFTTTRNPSFIHRVIAYAFVVGAEEMNNYFLGQEYNQYYQKNVAVSYRLCRIHKPHYSEASGSLDEEVVRYLEMMRKNDPQYALTQDNEICVRLTPEGRKSYQQIYFAKPDVLEVDEQSDGSALYYFDASPDQVFRFVIRFRAGEAEIVSPQELRERIHQHLRESLLPYERDQE